MSLCVPVTRKGRAKSMQSDRSGQPLADKLAADQSTTDWVTRQQADTAPSTDHPNHHPRQSARGMRRSFSDVQTRLRHRPNLQPVALMESGLHSTVKGVRMQDGDVLPALVRRMSLESRSSAEQEQPFTAKRARLSEQMSRADSDGELNVHTPSSCLSDNESDLDERDIDDDAGSFYTNRNARFPKRTRCRSASPRRSLLAEHSSPRRKLTASKLKTEFKL